MAKREWSFLFLCRNVRLDSSSRLGHATVQYPYVFPGVCSFCVSRVPIKGNLKAFAYISEFNLRHNAVTYVPARNV